MIGSTIYKATPDVAETRKSMNIPFDKLEPGLSVFLHFNECREDSLRALVSNQNAKGAKRYKVIKHVEKQYYEVTCLLVVSAERVITEPQIVESSEKAKSFKDETFQGKRKFPFFELPEGMSFILPIQGTNEKSLRVACCVQSKKLDKKFICVKHDDSGWFEVYNKPNKPIQFYEPSPQAKGE